MRFVGPRTTIKQARRALVAACLLVSFVSTASAEPHATFERAVGPFFATYCNRCHGAEKPGGDFRLDNLSRDFTDMAVAQRWSEIVFRINSGEMPPKKQPQPKPDELGSAVEWISARIKEGEAARSAKRGPVAHYRLSREEYGRTVYDLLGVYFDVNMPGAFNEEPRRHGFDRIGSLLALSPSHVERYFRAAESVVARAFPDRPQEPRITRIDANASPDKRLPAQLLLGPSLGIARSAPHRGSRVAHRPEDR